MVVPKKQYNKLATILKQPSFESTNLVIPDEPKYIDALELLAHTYFKKEYKSLTREQYVFLEDNWEHIIDKVLGGRMHEDLTKQEVFRFKQKYKLRFILIQPPEEVL